VNGTVITISGEQVMLGAVLLALVVGRFLARRGEPVHHIALKSGAIVYAALVVSLTLLPLSVGRPPQGFVTADHLQYSVNLVPFRTVMLYLRSDLGTIARDNLLGNVALLVPLGLLAPLVTRHLDGWVRVTLAGLVTSAGIEGLQFFRRMVDVAGPVRSVDIDDVILNTVGVVLGYAVFVVVRGVWRWSTRSRGPARLRRSKRA